ncbi:MAG: zinc ribbon domain-containing protein [Spirochaetales bacterium]|nr:zinc ribbon domain-containing protein [Spirochaetales bacterium]
MKRSGKQHGKRTDGLVFIGKIKCANCGGTFSRFVWYSTDKYKIIVLYCYDRYTGKNKRCQTENLREEDIKDLCFKEINSLLVKKDFDVMDEIREVLDTTALKKKYYKLSYELEAISSQIEDVVKRSARTAEHTTDKYDTLVKEYEKKRKESIELSNRIKDMEERLFRAEDFTKELRKLNKPLKKFDDEIFIRLSTI